MDQSVLVFYDNLAEDYHLIFHDWKHAVSVQGEVLNGIICSKVGSPGNEVMSLLDCSCGIGTQAIGLANHGFKVTATDLSPVSVERAKKHFLLQQENGQWITKHSKTRYRALLRDEFTHMLSAVGFSDIEWCMPSESGYYQPIVTARKKL